MRITFLFLTKILFLNEALSIDLNDYDLLLNPLTINNIYFIISVWTSYKNRRGDPTKKKFFLFGCAPLSDQDKQFGY